MESFSTKQAVPTKDFTLEELMLGSDRHLSVVLGGDLIRTTSLCLHK